MKKIMILGASILQESAILKAKEKGLQVIAIDKNPHAIGFQSADITLLISTIDIPEVIKATDKGVMRECLHANNIPIPKFFRVNNDSQYNHTGEVLVGEYMQGSEVSVESLTYQGITKAIAITDKLTTGTPRFVEMGHSQADTSTQAIESCETGLSKIEITINFNKEVL